jgi:hypothetical protein
MSIAAPPAPSKPAERNVLRRRLSALRARLRVVRAFCGAAWVLTAVFAILFTVGVWDLLLNLPSVVRALLLVGSLGGVGFMVYYVLLRPLSHRVDDLSLALELEELYPGLNDALATTVQFLDQPFDQAPDSAALRREAVRQAIITSRGCDFNRIVPTREMPMATLFSLIVAASTTLLLLFFWGPTTTALARFLNPFGEQRWPTRTRLALDIPRKELGRGELFTMHAKVEGVIPEHAVVMIRVEGIPEKRVEVPIEKLDETHGKFTFHEREVARSFRVQVRAGDGDSEEATITVVPPPSIVNGSLLVKVYPPPYTRLPSPQVMKPGQVDFEAVFGSDVSLQATADRPLRRAWLQYYQPADTPTLGIAAPVLGGLALAASGEFSGAVEGVLDEQKRSFQMRFRPVHPGVYVLTIEDTGKLPAQRTLNLRLSNDPTPVVRLERPSASKDLLTVLPTAVMTLNVQAEDPVFGLKSVFLRYRTKREDEPRVRELIGPSTGAAQLVAPVLGPGGLFLEPGAVRPARQEFLQPLPLKEFKHPDGLPLKDGDILILQACADDYDDVTPGKQPGCSPEIEIRIVSRNALDLALNQEQAKIQQDLDRAAKVQKEANQTVREMENKLKRNEKPTAEELDKLALAEQKQQQVAEMLGDEEKGMRADLARLQEAMKQNGLENSGERQKMKDAARELERLVANELEKIEPKLADAREQLDERSQAERKERLQERAKKSDMLAQEKKNQAAEMERRADDKETQAAQASDQQRREELRKEAEQLRTEAEKKKREAEELQKYAEQDRKDAAMPPTLERPREELAEARKAQDEIEKTFNQLLQDLEPYASTREVKAEAQKLLEDQRRAEAKAAELEKRDDVRGKTPEELKPERREELENLKDQQQRLEDRAKQLQDKMQRMAEEREKQGDQDTAKALKDALNQARENNLQGKMQEAREKIGKNQLTEARKDQQKAAEELEKLSKQLENRREAELQGLTKKLEEQKKKLEELQREQEELRKKAKEAEQKGDKEALKELNKKQKQLQQKLEEQVKELKRQRAGRAAQALAKAGEEMEANGQKLQGGQGDDKQNEEILDRIKEAKQEIQRAQKEAKEELLREQLRKVAEALTRMKERQETLIAEADRVQDAVLQQKEWKRGLKDSLNKLRDNQNGLSEETRDLTKKELTETPVFSKLVEKAAEAMTKAAERMQTLTDTVPEKLPDAEIARQQKEALRWLNRLLEAIKEQVNAGQPQGGNQGGNQGGDEGDGDNGGAQPQQEKGLPPMAQIKLLRELMNDLKKQVETFRKDHPDLDKLDDKSKAELEAMQREQRDVVELYKELRRQPGEPGDDGDKKDDNKKPGEGEKKP